jgi:AcrR family transcriptional regulator
MTSLVSAPKKTPSLKEQIIQAASRIFETQGNEGLSMRRVAQEVGCSQMAMYRHFANKEALVQHICGDIYTHFAARIQEEIAGEVDPRRKLRRFIRAVLQFAEQYPDHYSLIFLVRHSDPRSLQPERTLGGSFLRELRKWCGAHYQREVQLW